MFGLRWFGPKEGSGIGPRTWQAWIVIAVYVLFVLCILPTLPLASAVKHQIWGISTGLLIAIMLLTYKGR